MKVTPMDVRSIEQWRALAVEIASLADAIFDHARAIRIEPAAPMSAEAFEARLAQIRRVRQELTAMATASRDRLAEIQRVRQETESMLEATRQRIECAGLPEAKVREIQAEADRVLNQFRLPPGTNPTPSPNEPRS